MAMREIPEYEFKNASVDRTKQTLSVIIILILNISALYIMLKNEVSSNIAVLVVVILLDIGFVLKLFSGFKSLRVYRDRIGLKSGFGERNIPFTRVERVDIATNITLELGNFGPICKSYINAEGSEIEGGLGVLYTKQQTNCLVIKMTATLKAQAKPQANKEFCCIFALQDQERAAAILNTRLQKIRKADQPGDGV